MLQRVCSTIVSLVSLQLREIYTIKAITWVRIAYTSGDLGFLDTALSLMESVNSEYTYYDNLPAMPGYELRDSDGAVEAWEKEQRSKPKEVYREDVSEALRFVVNWLLGCKSASTIGGRALLLGQLIGVDHGLNKNFAAIADAAGCSREAIRQAAKQLEDFAGMRTQLNRTDSARRSCKRARLRSLSSAR